MAQKTSGIYRLTQIPRLYSLLQMSLGASSGRERLVREFIRPRPGDHILDLGCGPADILPSLGKVSYVGIDLNSAHIASASARYGDRGRFLSGDFSLLNEIDMQFDIVICIGLLHHLDDHAVIDLAALARSKMRPEARFVAVDPVFEKGQPWIAKQLASADSGQNVRFANEYRELIAAKLDNVKVDVRHDLLRLPYSHCMTIAQRLD